MRPFRGETFNFKIPEFIYILYNKLCLPVSLFATEKRQICPMGRLMDVHNYKKLPPNIFDFRKISKIHEKKLVHPEKSYIMFYRRENADSLVLKLVFMRKNYFSFKFCSKMFI